MADEEIAKRKKAEEEIAKLKMAEEEIAKLKVARRQCKGVVTRYLNSVKRHMAERRSELVQAKLDKLLVAFDNLEEAHDLYHDDLTDDNEIQESEKWFTICEVEYTEGVKAANDWLEAWFGRSEIEKPDSADDDSTSDKTTDPSLELQARMINLLSIPKVELDSFSGDPLEYQTFFAIFDELIDANLSNDQVKLTRLLQYTKGPAKESIRNCALIGGAEGYKKAREILRSRYGNDHLVSHKIIQDLKEGKPVVSAVEIRQLADDLAMACKALEQKKLISELDTQQNILDILLRCPEYIKRRWYKLALKTKQSTDNYPRFSEFVEFMNNVSTEACDPVYGKARVEQSGSVSSYALTGERPQSQSGVGSVQSRYFTGGTPMARSSSETNRPCVLCQGPHRLLFCSTFKTKTPQERLNLVQQHRLCFNCLYAGHRSSTCRKESICSMDGCGMKHTWLVHVDTRYSQAPAQANNTSLDGGVPVQAPVESNNVGTVHALAGTLQTLGQTDSTSPDIDAAHTNITSQRVCLPVVPVVVNGSVNCYALLDTGSTASFISESLAGKLGLGGEDVSFRVNTVSASTVVQSKRVSVELSPRFGAGSSFRVDGLLTIPQVPARYSFQPQDVVGFPHLADVPLHFSGPDERADVLIGMDNAYLLKPLEIRCNEKDHRQPYATRSELGWSLNGLLPTGGRQEVFCNAIDIEGHLENLWKVDSLEADGEAEGYSLDDLRVLELFESSAEVEDGHMVLPIPWMDGCPDFPDNYWFARHRLNSVERRLEKLGVKDKYYENFQKMVSKGYVELVPDEEIGVNDSTVWFLPHHCVVSESKPGKVRQVYDCAAKVRGVSLNNQVLKGPDLNNKLVHVLLRFRQFPYAIIADVEAMYLQVRIPVEDRNALRFLWHEGDRVVQYRMTSHLFGGIWCAASSTFALRCTARDPEVSQLVRDTICRSFYVDDLLRSTPSIGEGKEVVLGVPEATSKYGFHVTKFVCSHAELYEGVEAEDRADAVKEISMGTSMKALGILWQVDMDAFYYRSKIPIGEQVVSRRFMLSQVASLYDPLGLIAPVILQGKALFQEATKFKLAWDSPVPEELLCRWTAWVESLSALEMVKFARCVVPEEFVGGIYELHHFADASTTGYGACSYLRCKNKDGQIHVSLLTAKGRLAPIKEITIPRLELCAAVEAIRLDVMIRRELDLELLPSTFWTDSQIVLAYIHGYDDTRFKVFVANRVSVIRQNSEKEQWHHIAGKENPADVVSRGCCADVLPALWCEGPAFLSQWRSEWSTVLSTKPRVPEVEVEFAVSLAANAGEVVMHPIDRLAQYYSDLYRLKKAVVWWVRFGSYLQKTVVQGAVTAAELVYAEKVLITHSQHVTYEKEVSSLQRGVNVPARSDVVKLCPKLEDGMMVVGGRLKHADTSHRARFPFILSGAHRLSYLIVQEYHSRAHLGIEWVLSNIRNKYWISGVRKILKAVKHKCVICKRLYAEAATQKMSDLPPERVTANKPAFHVVGVDVFGPFHVCVKRSSVKRYGCLYTCFSSRAIHIEKLDSLDAQSFVNGFVRFCSRRGCPAKVFSDNGTNIVGATSELSRGMRELDKAKVVAEARQKEVEWVFNPPYASHQGGVWERQIRTVRRVLMAVLGTNERMSDEMLVTAFCEVEGLVNSRPLTKCSPDVDDPEPLTPNHLLLAQGNYSLPRGVFCDADVLRKHWRHVQRMVDLFWRRWVREYVHLLQSRMKWTNVKPNIKVGDLVLVVDGSLPRGSWPVGRVLSVKAGRDDLVRSAKLQTKSNVVTRPITKLVPLECD